MHALNPPTKGQIYVSTTDPTERILVETVTTWEADEDTDAGFAVETCEERHRNRPGEMGTDYNAEEWAEFLKDHRLTSA